MGRSEHRFLGILGLAMIGLHFFWFWELYGGLAINGISTTALGAGALYWANLLILIAALCALIMLIYAAVRSFRADEGTGFLPTLLLLGVGALLPWAGIALSFVIAGTAA